MCNDNYIKLTRLLSTNQNWLDARPSHQSVLICILLRMAYAETTQIHSGHKVQIKPYQLYVSQNKLAEWSSKWITKDDVQGAIKYFSKCKFLLHEVLHQKSMITIIDSEICEQFLKSSPPVSPPAFLRHSSTKEEREEREEYKKEINKEKIFSIFENSNENPNEVESQTQVMVANGNSTDLNFSNSSFSEEKVHISTSDNIRYVVDTKQLNETKKHNKSQEKSTYQKVETSPKINRKPYVATSKEDHDELIDIIENKKKYAEVGTGEYFLDLCYEELSQWKNEKIEAGDTKELNSHTDKGRIKRWVINTVKENELKQKEIKKKEDRINGNSSLGNTSEVEINMNYAKEIYLKYSKNQLEIRGYILNLGHNYLEFTPDGGNAQPMNIKFSEKGFIEQVESKLRKCVVN